MVTNNGKRQDRSTPPRGPEAGVRARRSSKLQAGVASPGPTAQGRPASLSQKLRERSTWDLIKSAEIIYAVDCATGERCGVFFGDPRWSRSPFSNPTDPGPGRP